VFDAVPEDEVRVKGRGKVKGAGAGKYDVILSNPPYEPSAHVDAQAPEFAAEPRMAHDGGCDGLEIIRKLLRQARSRLTDEGIVLIEVGGLIAAVDKEFAALEPHWLHTDDGADCVCVIHAARLARWTG
jgi:ribosomal protein L3 glutamine methyltransferase